jgi:hypothetical protein
MAWNSSFGTAPKKKYVFPSLTSEYFGLPSGALAALPTLMAKAHLPPNSGALSDISVAPCAEVFSPLRGLPWISGS